MVKIKLPILTNKDRLLLHNHSEKNKLWDNDELVMRALKVYGKYPRPQCYYEISKACNLSNIRKSRYFHEKMMRNNPYEEKIRKLLADEGEHAYPFFRIFFDEYKTKKEREKLIHGGVNGDLERNNGHKSEITDEENLKEYDSLREDCELIASTNLNSDLLNNSWQFLENLELKYKLLDKQREGLLEYFNSFSHTINTLREKIKSVKENDDSMIGEVNLTALEREKKELEETTNLDSIEEKLNKFIEFFARLNTNVVNVAKEQDLLRNELREVKICAESENKRLENGFNECKLRLKLKEDELDESKRKMEDLISENCRVNKSYAQLRKNFELLQTMVEDVKENILNAYNNYKQFNHVNNNEEILLN